MILEAPPGGPGGEQQGAPQHTNGDFAGVRVFHKATDVRIYARFVDLSPRGQSITIGGMIFIQTKASPIHADRYVVEWNPLGAPDCDQPVQECWTLQELACRGSR